METKFSVSQQGHKLLEVLKVNVTWTKVHLSPGLTLQLSCDSDQKTKAIHSDIYTPWEWM